MNIKLIAECRKINKRITFGISVIDDMYFDEAFVIINFLFWRIRLGFSWSEYEQ